jgi:hypothetical protein
MDALWRKNYFPSQHSPAKSLYPSLSMNAPWHLPCLCLSNSWGWMSTFDCSKLVCSDQRLDIASYLSDTSVALAWICDLIHQRATLQELFVGVKGLSICGRVTAWLWISLGVSRALKTLLGYLFFEFSWLFGWIFRNSLIAELSSSIMWCCSLICVVNCRIDSLSSFQFVSCSNSPLQPPHSDWSCLLSPSSSKSD